MKTIKDFQNTSINIEETKQVKGGGLDPQPAIVFAAAEPDTPVEWSPSDG